MKQYYLISTDHLAQGVWFKDEDDYKAGMNLFAVQASRTPVKILAFILMSNHVHAVVHGEREDAELLIINYKKLYSMYLNTKYGCKSYLRRNNVDLRPVALVDEALEKAIAYVQMNSVAANICSSPTQYPWGTGNIYFNKAHLSGIRIGNMSKRLQKKAFHSTRSNIPKDWLVGDDGYVLPASYVDVKFVEALYRTPKRMNYFLQNSSKARRVLDAKEQHTPVFKDALVQASVPDLCWGLFRKGQVSELTEEEQVEILRQLRFRFNSNPNQLTRVTGFSYEDVARLLDRA